MAVLENDFEAGLLDALLDEQGIPHLMISYYDTAYDGLFQTQKGWGHVRAPRAFVEPVLAVLSDIREGGGGV